MILAHIGKHRGMGMKCADYFAVYSCSACHDIIDGRVPSVFSMVEIEREKLRALEETQAKLFEKVLLNVVS